jgi:hypothetical protein
MKFHSLLIIFLFVLLPFVPSAQNTENSWEWWNQLHGWEPGDPGWRNWMKITPGYLGPNALPVPQVKKGFLEDSTEIEATFSHHFHPGDPTQDFSARLFIPFANNRIAVEMYGVVIERFAFTEEIRNERIARDKDGKGMAAGDFYFSTLIQLSKNRRFPNTLLRAALKTASGNQLEAARNTDSPGYFFDVSFSKDIGKVQTGIFRPFGLVGFYSWQTNDELNLQNDALMYAIGADWEKERWLVSASWSGYSGYKNRRDRPMQLNFDFRKEFKNKALKLQYQHGLRSWGYKTLRVSFIWKLRPAV